MKHKGKVIGLCVLLCACSSNTRLLYVQEATMGFDLGLSSSGNQKISVGYTSDTFAAVPTQNSEGKMQEVSSVVSATCGVVQTTFMDIEKFDFRQFSATGDAATELVKDGSSTGKIIRNIYGEECL